MVHVVLNERHLPEVVREVLVRCRHRLFLATADVKDLHVPDESGRGARSVLDVLGELAERGVEVRLLHGGVPSGPFIERLKSLPSRRIGMRRCPRNHIKAVIADSVWMYIGSANLTGAGLGAKGKHRRNFEAGICADRPELIDPVLDMLDDVWTGGRCAECERREHCPAPLEEPEL